MRDRAASLFAPVQTVYTVGPTGNGMDEGITGMTENSNAQSTAEVHKDWAGRGEHWDVHADAIAKMAARFNLPLIEAAGINSGQQVLDCATGAGEPALTIASMIAPEGQLTASDLVAEMIAGAERRAKDQNISNITFKVSDMTDLPFDDGAFDRVICRFGLMFVPEPERATKEACRVLKPGGRAAYMVWGSARENTAFDVLQKASDAAFGADDPLVELDAPFSLADDGALEAVLEAGGFDETSVETLHYQPKVPAGRPFWASQVEMGVGRRLDVATPEERRALDEAMAQGYGEYLKDDTYHLSAAVRIGVGVKRG